jgi:antitoxin VapB
MGRAKVFWSGNSQAVRLPKRYRLDPGVEEVKVSRKGAKLILEPVRAEKWPEEFWNVFGKLPEELERPAPVTSKRDELDP